MKNASSAARVVVVGGSSGIGLGVARAALDRGAEVTIVGRSHDRLEEARRTAGALRIVVADATNEADVVRLFETTGPFDHLVVTAVVGAYAPIGTIEAGAVRGHPDIGTMRRILARSCLHRNDLSMRA